MSVKRGSSPCARAWVYLRRCRGVSPARSALPPSSSPRTSGTRGGGLPPAGVSAVTTAGVSWVGSPPCEPVPPRPSGFLAHPRPRLCPRALRARVCHPRAHGGAARGVHSLRCARVGVRAPARPGVSGPARRARWVPSGRFLRPPPHLSLSWVDRVWDPVAVAVAVGDPPPPAVLPANPPDPGGDPPVGVAAPLGGDPDDEWALADLLAFHGEGGFDG